MRGLRKARKARKEAKQQAKIVQAQEKRFPIQKERKRVMICSPMGDLCHANYTTSLIHVASHTLVNAHQDLDLSFLYFSTSILPMARQLLAVRSLEAEATHILWVDADMEFPPDTILRMIRHDKPIVAANCMARRAPFQLTARYEDGKQCYTTAESTGLEKVCRVGFGLVWMSTEVLRKIPMPWFEFEWLPEKYIYKGEDYTFCTKAREAGFEIYVDHDISKEVKHIGLFAYNPLILSSIPEEMRQAISLDENPPNPNLPPPPSF